MIELGLRNNVAGTARHPILTLSGKFRRIVREPHAAFSIVSLLDADLSIVSLLNADHRHLARANKKKF